MDSRYTQNPSGAFIVDLFSHLLSTLIIIYTCIYSGMQYRILVV